MALYENNIRENYFDYVKHFVNYFCNKKEILENLRDIKNKEERSLKIKNFTTKINSIYTNVLDIKNKKIKQDNTQSDLTKLINTVNVDKEHKELFEFIKKTTQQYDAHNTLIDFIKKIILPDKKIYEKDSIKYDIKCNPMDYFKPMHKMMLMMDNNGKYIYNLYPLRTSIVPKYMKLDTTTLVNLLMETDKIKYKTKLVELGDKIWNTFFKLDNKVFKLKHYKFDHSIITDGVGCSIQFIREEYYNKYAPKTKKLSGTELYIDELGDDEYDTLKGKQIVAIDPNKGDLIYCVDGIEKERNQYRYTQEQRKKETKSKKYKNLLLELKKEKINGETITEIETKLSAENRKTLNFIKFKKYLSEKHNMNNTLEKFYSNKLFRKLNLNGYLNRIQSEQRMMSRFKEIYGNNESTVVCIGDWCQKEQMKFKEPTIGKRIRKIFKDNGYEVYLVNEFRTSCKCSICEGDCEKFRERLNPRPWKTNKIVVHGLLKCKSCRVLWNRDENSSNNIYKIARLAINKICRPKYLCRT
jgi:hypothetical protein